MEFWVKTELLEQPDIKKKQVEYYARTYAEHIRALKPVVAHFPEDAIVITSQPLGHALKYLAMTGVLRNKVHLVPTDREDSTAKHLKAKRVVTLASPLSGFRPEPLWHLEISGEGVVLIDNMAR